MNGLLLINKPANWTSHDIVAKIRGILRSATKNQQGEATRKVRVGHAGTLDPFATGLLIILVGNYTKRAGEFLKLDKTYRVGVKLGEISTTGDPEGKLQKVSTSQPGIDDIESVLKKFTGQQMQTPPAFSAMKINGQRAYKLARAGKDVNLTPRQITIHSISNIKYKYPNLEFETAVSSGTYIRSLVSDIGKALKVGAYCTSLERLKISTYSLAEAHDIEKIHISNLAGLLKDS